MNTPLVFNGCLYAYGNDIYVHQYSIPEQKWSVIPKSGVVLPKAWIAEQWQDGYLCSWASQTEIMKWEEFVKEMK